MSRDRDVVEKVIASLRNIGQFEVSPLREDESGGCYKAFDAVRRITITIRTLWPHSRPDGDLYAQKLLAQARASQNVDAPNVAKIIGSGELEGAFFFVSTFIDGHTLRENLRSGERLGTSDLIDFARQACDGVESAHSRGLVHHALHPENIAIEFDGSTKILDLALYRAHDPAADAFHPAAIYLAPEQLEGHDTDRYTNFYSIATMLYEIACGKSPFTGNSWESLAESMRGELIEPVKINPSVPPGINAAIVKALARDRAQRFSNGPELVRALEDYRSFGKPKVTAAPPVPVIAPLIAKPLEKPQGSLATASLTFADTPPAPPAADGPRLAVESVMIAVQGQAMAARAGAGADVAPVSPDMITHFSAPSVPFKRTPPPIAPALSPEELVPVKPKGPSKLTLAKNAALEFSQRMLAEGIRKFKQIDPWVIALTCVIVVLAGFILRTVALSFWATPHAAEYGADAAATPAPQPTTAAPVKAIVAAAAVNDAPLVPDTTTILVPQSKTLPVAPKGSAKTRNASKKAQVTLVQPLPAPAVSTPFLGSVVVTSNPDGAHVIVDGKTSQTFTTPQTIAMLSPGTHTLTISKDGYTSATRTVSITAGAQSNLAVQLALPTASLNVLSSPTTAYILIDGVSTGRVTPSQVQVPPGTHTLTLRKLGYLEASDTITLTAGEQQSKTIALLEAGSTPDIRVAQTGKVKKLFGGKISGVKVSVRTEPAGATVVINGQTVTKGTPVEFGLNPGNYVIELQLNGYQTLRKTITVQDGTPLALNEMLHP